MTNKPFIIFFTRGNFIRQNILSISASSKKNWVFTIMKLLLSISMLLNVTVFFQSFICDNENLFHNDTFFLLKFASFNKFMASLLLTQLII